MRDSILKLRSLEQRRFSATVRNGRKIKRRRVSRRLRQNSGIIPLVWFLNFLWWCEVERSSSKQFKMRDSILKLRSLEQRRFSATVRNGRKIKRRRVSRRLRQELLEGFILQGVFSFCLLTFILNCYIISILLSFCCFYIKQ